MESQPVSNNFDILITEISNFVSSMENYFTERFKDLHIHSPMFNYILQPDIKESYKIDEKYFKFLTSDFLELEIIEFNNS